MKNKVYAVTRLSQTRWSTSADAMKTWTLNYLEVLETLSIIAECSSTKPKSVCQPLLLIQSLS